MGMEGRRGVCTARTLCGVQSLPIQGSVCQAVLGYIHTVRQIVSMDDLTVLASQSPKPGELHGNCGAPPQPAGLRFCWEKQSVGSK